MGILAGVGVLLLAGGQFLAPYGPLLTAWGLIAIARVIVMAVAGGRPESRWCTDPRLPALSLAPFVIAGVLQAVTFLSGPAGLLPAIECIAASLGVVTWAVTQYLWDEMVCTRGVWHSRERWIDPSVAEETKARWEAERIETTKPRS